MYKKTQFNDTSLNVNESLEGETLETKMERVTTNKEPIKDGAPLIYTERKDGVQPGYNIRTDRFEIAVEAMDKVTSSNLAKRDYKPNMEIVKNDKDESIDGTGTN